MAWAVPLSDVDVDDELVAAAVETLKSGWWSMGPRVEAFEQAFAALTGSAHAFAVANGTAALHLGLLAVGCGPGDEVILPSLNFVAAANTIRHTGATPVFCDIRGEDDLNLDVADVEAAVTPSTKAIVALHYGGFACDIDELRDLSEKHGLVLLEDAAHAPGGSVHGQACGTFGALGCFSFFSNKNLPLGEGGMIVTDDDEIGGRLRLLRSHGMTTLTWDRHRGHAHSYDVELPGFNYRLDELRAAIGLVQLSRLAEANAARAAAAARYRALLEGVTGLVMPFGDRPADEVSSHHLTVVVLPDGTDRTSLRDALTAEGIQTSVHYPPIHHFTAYADAPGARPLPETDRVADRILTLPLYPSIRPDQVELVASHLRAALLAPHDERAVSSAR